MTSRSNPLHQSQGGPRTTLSGPDIVTRLLAEARLVNDLDVTIYGQVLTFKYRDLLWTVSQQVVSDAWEEIDVKLPNGKTEKQRHYNTQKLILTLFELMFMQPDLEALQPFPLTPQVVRALKPEVGKQFAVVFPQDSIAEEVAAIEDEKKECGASSAASC